jgi:epoxyqueuosine reductase
MPVCCLACVIVRPTPADDERPAERDPVGYLAELTALGHEHGLDRIGVTSADVLERARAALYDRKAAGLHDTMQFTYRNPDRSTDPDRAVPGARSVLVGARSYLVADGSGSDVEDHVEDDVEGGGGPQGRIARYAWDDHYAPLRTALRVIARRLRADGYRAVAFADDNAMVDREVAHRAGLGWFGKNANLLVPGAGSWFVLGSVVTTAPLPAVTEPVADGCGTCVRCIDGCPTGAIVAPGVVDARRCLSWLLQKPGDFPLEFREALGDRIYGCDDCQEVCPPTVHLGHRVTRRDPASVRRTAPLLEMLAASDDELVAEYGQWYLAERNPQWWRRNALVVLGNTADPTDAAVRDVLHRYRDGIDPVLASHAAWAVDRLDRRAVQ